MTLLYVHICIICTRSAVHCSVGLSKSRPTSGLSRNNISTGYQQLKSREREWERIREKQTENQNETSIELESVFPVILGDSAEHSGQLARPGLGAHWQGNHPCCPLRALPFGQSHYFANFFWYRVFIKYCVFSSKCLIFLNSASSAAALVFFLPDVWRHTDTKRKQRKARIRNILK